MDKKYLNIKVQPGNAFRIKTDESFCKLHQLQIINGRRGMGKSTFAVNFFRMMRQNSALDKVILITSTYESNKDMFKDLPVTDIIHPDNVDAIKQVRDIMDAERDLLDTYHSELKRWESLNKMLKGRQPIETIDEDLLLFFGERFEKPTHYLNGRKPVVALFIDDSLGTRVFGVKSGLNQLCVTHRHLAVSETLGPLGLSIFMATQSYVSNAYGINPTIRNNTTSLVLFQTKNEKELFKIAEEVGGFVTLPDFLNVYEQAMEGGEHNVLFIDLNPHKGNSFFRKNMNEMLYPKKNISSKN